MAKNTAQTRTTSNYEALVDSSGNLLWQLNRNLHLGKFANENFYKCAVIDKNGNVTHHKLSKKYDFEEAEDASVL